jgi:hypothetical protein
VSDPVKVDKSLEVAYIPGSQKSPREIGKSRVRLPSFKVVVPLSVSSSFLFDLFISSCTRYKFHITEQTSHSITAIQTLTSTMRNLFTCILPISEEKKAKTSSIVRIDIAVNEKNCARVVTVKGTYGFPNRIYQVIQLFKESLEKAGTEFLKETKEDSDFTLPTLQTAYYQVSRFLSNSEVPAGQMFISFHDEFWQKFSDLDFAARQVKEMTTMLKTSIDSINDLLSSSVSQFSRISIEKYIYSKLFPHIKKVYMHKKSETSSKFKAKRDENLSTPDEDLMRHLDIKEKFCIKGSVNPYSTAIESLNNLEKHTSPIDKLNCILESTTHMKTTVIDYWKGKQELETMDDQLPVIIFIVCRVGIESFPAQIEFLLDYTRANSGMDNENRLLINYDAAISFIINDM